MAAAQWDPEHPSLLYLRHSLDSIHVQNIRTLLPGDILASGFRGCGCSPTEGSDPNERSGASVGSTLSHGVPARAAAPPRRVDVSCSIWDESLSNVTAQLDHS